ncbi:MAG: OmpA family protein [Bacteroidales bacterium]
MIRKVLILFIITLTTTGLFAQEPEEDLSLLSNGKLKREGKAAMEEQNYHTAIRYFEEYCRHKEDYKIMYLLAENYRFVRNYPFAQYWYDRAYKTNPEKNAKALFYYAEMLLVNKEYEEAAQFYSEFRKIYRDYDDSRNFRRKAKNNAEFCEIATDSINNTLDIRINQLNSSINTNANESAPLFLTSKSFLYGSLEIDTTPDPNIDSIPVPKYYAASYSEQSSWKGMGEYALQESEDPLRHSQNGAFSPDFQRFYFVKCEKEKGFLNLFGSKETCKLYQSKKIYGVWQDPEPLPDIVNVKNANIYSVTVGTESRRNDEVLYYVTDRKDGRVKGGLDIWYTIYQSKKEEWREPKNGGNRINSPGDERTPFYDEKNRTLYFSSNGHGGFGNLDMYTSIGELGRWTPAENMGYPISTPYDDYHFAISDDGKKAVLASNRPGGNFPLHASCCDDLYAIDFENIIEIPIAGRVFEIEDEELQQLLKEGFKGEALQPDEDSLDVHFIENSTVSLFVGNTNEKIFIASTETNEDGEYFFNVDPDKEYVLQFEHVKTGSAMIPFSTQGITKPDTLQMDDYGINYITKDPLIIKNIYYDYGKYKLTDDHKETIDGAILKLLREAPEIVVEISSHTDNHGSAKFNYKLSQKRASEIVDYLVSKGIDESRLEAKGFGFDKPIAPNVNPDGSDNPEGRQLNRRTEFRVVGALENIIDYTDYED